MTLLRRFAVPLNGFSQILFGAFAFFQRGASRVLIFFIAATGVAQLSLKLLLRRHFFEDGVTLVVRLLLPLREGSAEPEVRFGQIKCHTAAAGQRSGQSQL